MLVSCDYFKPIGQTNLVKFSDLQVVNYLENAMIGKENIMTLTILLQGVILQRAPQHMDAMQQ